MIRLANAPVSYGVFELSRPDAAPLPDGEQLVRDVAEAGYAGIDLGPVGYLGRGPQLRARLEQHDLGLAGGWIDFPFTGTDEQFEAAFAVADDALDQMVAVADLSPLTPPRPTLADSGDARRKAAPGGGEDLMLDDDGWARFGDRLARVAAHVRARGLEPTFHHHACTYVETPAEVDRFLEIGDVDLTFDTGHLLVGGGDPLGDLRRWLPRINHVHLKDANRAVLAAAVGTEDPVAAIWSQRVFVALGEGDLEVAGMVEAIIDSGYDGWIVVEQDVIPASLADVELAQRDQVANREALRGWFP